MSLASDYAATQATAANGQATANAAVPAPFVGPGGGRAEVSVTGGLRLVPGTGTSSLDITSAAALALRDWITATFG